MTISTGIPANWNLPLFWATVDGSMAGNLSNKQAAIMVGQYNVSTGSIGAGGANVPVAVGGPAQGTALFGAGSMLDRMSQAFFASNPNQLLYALPIADPGGGAVATGSITIGGSPTAAGTLYIYIAGQLIQVAVAVTDTPTTIGAAIAAAIAANAQLPVTAIATTGAVALTSVMKGTIANDITIQLNYFGPGNAGSPGSAFNAGQVLPAGVTATIVAMSGGTGSPVFTGAISAIQMFPYAYFIMPYTDTGSLTTWNTEVGFSAGGRWAYSRQQYGMVFSAYRAATYSGALSAGAGWNYPVISVMVWETTTPSPVWECAAAYGALGALGFSDDPARPLQTLEMIGILPTQLANRFMQGQLNALTNSGFAIQGVAPDGNPQILREQTTYQLNNFGQSDTAFGLLTVLSTLAELLNRMKSAITSKYARVKLVPDGTRLARGQAAITPSIAKAELIAEFINAMYDGLVADLGDFEANLQVSISNNNPNVLQVLWAPQLAGQLRQFEVLAQFRLLYENSTINNLAA